MECKDVYCTCVLFSNDIVSSQIDVQLFVIHHKGEFRMNLEFKVREFRMSKNENKMLGQ